MNKYFVNEFIINYSHCISVIRTLMGRFARIWYRRNNHKWVDVMDDICRSYNNTYHTSIHTKPADVNDSNAADVFFHLYKGVIGAKEAKPKFMIGQKVHVRGKRTTFRKGYMQQFSPDVYIIKEIVKTNPITYKLITDTGGEVVSTYYAEELVPGTSID